VRRSCGEYLPAPVAGQRFFQGVLGGTMHFVPDEKVIPIQPSYVFAEFEDGHIAGAMLRRPGSTGWSTVAGPAVRHRTDL
jgi:hypothetical protein